ncbi:MAG: HD domain-containing protein [Bacteroidia bacterium]|nr:HD domain-containing protein [Bacteroidia bacterium]
MNTDWIIGQTIQHVKSELRESEGGHDWWHIYRVWSMARHIAQTESVDQLVVELGALLHDIADSKFHGGDEEIGPHQARAFMESLGLEALTVQHVENIVRYISFKGGREIAAFKSPELAVVQDADRLDAIGAIGIARAFNYGGYRGRALYDPDIPPDLNMDKEAYKKSQAPTINHFYEKLLRLKERMNTRRGRELAEERHRFMEQYLERFYREWEGQW